MPWMLALRCISAYFLIGKPENTTWCSALVMLFSGVMSDGTNCKSKHVLKRKPVLFFAGVLFKN